MLPAVLAEAVRRFGDRPAYLTDGWEPSYRDLDRLSDETAAGLAARGVRPGDVVALALPTSPEYPVCFLAAAKLGAVTAGLNTRLAGVEQERLIGAVQPRVVVATADSPVGGSENAVLVELSVDGRDPLAGLRAPGEVVDLVAPDPDRPVAVVFTSGTTGTPKGAVFGERQIAAIRRSDVGEAWGQGGRSLVGTSMAHLGFMTKLAGFLSSGSTGYLMTRWRAADALRLTAELGLTSLSGVPTQLALMLAEPALDKVDLSSLRQVLIGGGPATPALVRAARERLGVPVCTRYSCTEAGIGCGTSPTDPPEDAESTVGRPRGDVELAVRDPEGAGVAPGEIGEVLLRSPAVMSGYWQDPQATAAAFTSDGFVRTGDLGFVDERGRLHLAGRSRQLYVRGGYNVHPVAVEAVLSTHPSVRDVAVVPRPDDVMGEIGVAVVVAEGAPPTLDELRAHGRASLATHELPEALVVVDALPLTPGEKVDRPELARRVARAD